MNSDCLPDITAIPMQQFTELERAEDKEYILRIKQDTPARVCLGHCGARYKTRTMLRFRADQAAAADAVFSEVSSEVVALLNLFEVQTLCADKEEMLKCPDKGRLFGEVAKETIQKRCLHSPDVQIYIGDGLCSPSVAANVPDLLPAITKGLEFDGVTVGTPFFVRYCRVDSVRVVAELLEPKVTCVLIGERPGLLTAESMSAYIVYGAYADMPESRYSVVSNISRQGMPPVEAAAYIVELIEKMLKQKASGLELC